MCVCVWVWCIKSSVSCSYRELRSSTATFLRKYKTISLNLNYLYETAVVESVRACADATDTDHRICMYTHTYTQWRV